MKHSKWLHLPNAKHIGFVIESVGKYPDAWTSAWDAARDAARYEAWDAVWDAAKVAAYDAARYEAWDAAMYEAWAIWYPAKGSILALVAYDDCEQYLDMSYNELVFMAKLTQIPATILLLPYAKAMELINESAN
jgi:hypothetical protein